jgi:U3 small nucleolar RNA-associated protein 16
MRKKRKERDTILKQQAKSKRKREEDVEFGYKMASPLEIPPPNRRRDASGNDNIDGKQATSIKRTSPLKLTPGSALPEFLPEEYLEENGSEDDTALETVNPSKRAKKTKFMELVEKRPKDIRKGSTTYRVTEVRSTKLAPKSSFNARTVKESWLQGRTGASRKPFSGGFFKST